MSLERLIDQTRARFPHLNESQVEILPLDKGGSDRRYYRVRFTADHLLILVKVQFREDRKPTVCGDCEFSERDRSQCAHVYYHDQEQALIWMQDLGEEDLWHHFGMNRGPFVVSFMNPP